MPIPDFQTIMDPLLGLLDDGDDHRQTEAVDRIADQFGVSPEEGSMLLPSGRQTVLANRVAWATTHLAKAGLIERTGRGRFRLTERGRQALRDQATGDQIRVPYLKRFPEYREFRGKSDREEDHSGQQTLHPSTISIDGGLTPVEALEASYLALRTALGQELLDRIKQAPPSFFEQVVLDLLVAMGYGGSYADAAQAVGRSGDDGIDGIIKEDKLGLDFVYVQAKRWDGPVRRPDVQAFAGSLMGQRAGKGVFITTSKFTKDAEEYVTRIEKRIVLVNGERLAELMIDHGVGVADVATFRIKRVDTDYFDPE
ncbi:MAG TPA: restriction endonuclease [Thermomicrobiales bacterium]|nr:restriction endonuclease [Thermomicrobiales bacterium]